jgi:hypothetical protein
VRDDDLTVYLARCLGGVACGIIATLYAAAPRPAQHVDLFGLIANVGVILTLVHVWGAIVRRQPWTETAEIALYATVTGAALWLRATL